jgi:hypothetical protein
MSRVVDGRTSAPALAAGDAPPRPCASSASGAGVAAPRRHALALLAVAPLAACVAPVSLDAPAVAELSPPVPDWIATRATEADDGRRIELARGASLAVSLRAPTAAGVGWREVAVPAGLVRTGRFTGPVWPKDAPSSLVAPAPLWQVFVFEARDGAGGELALELTGDTAARPRRLVLRVDVR